MTVPSRAEAALEPELMDRDDLPLAETERALADIGRVHTVVGIRAIRRTLLPRLAGGRRIVLDLGTGNGALAARLAGVARRLGIELRTVGVDRKLAHLAIGRRQGFEQRRVVADAAALPFADGCLDAAFSTLLFHHFDGPTNRRILDEMRRVARGVAVVVDLRRSRLGSLLGRVVLFLLGLGPVARYDGRLSLDQAWRLDEVRRLLATGEVAEVRRRWPFRWSLVLEPQADADSRQPRCG